MSGKTTTELKNRSLTARELIAILEEAGLRQVSQEGSHRKFNYPKDGPLGRSLPRPIIIDHHNLNDTVPRDHVKQKLRAAGLSHLWENEPENSLKKKFAVAVESSQAIANNAASTNARGLVKPTWF